MALTYNLSKIPDWENTCFIENTNPETKDQEPRVIHPVLHTMIWASLSVQCSWRDLQEVSIRLRILGCCDIYVATKNGQGWIPTIQDMEPFKELRTNVINLNRGEWNKWLMNRLTRMVMAEIHEEQNQIKH